MNLKERVTSIDEKYQLAGLLVLALTVGFVADATTNVGLASSGDTRAESQSVTAGSAGLDAKLAESDSTDSGMGGESSGSDRKVITTVRTTLETSDVRGAQDSISSRAESSGGFVESSSFDEDQGVTGRLTVAVPSDNLSSFMTDLESNYNVKSKSVNRDDVTDQYNELESELESKKQEMERLKELMNQTDSVDSLVNIQERMSDLRGRIDYLQQRMDDLDDQVEYSRVHVTLEGPQLFRTGFNLGDAFSEAYRALFDSIRLLILGAAYLLPFAILVALYKLVKGRVRN